MFYRPLLFLVWNILPISGRRNNLKYVHIFIHTELEYSFHTDVSHDNIYFFICRLDKKVMLGTDFAL